MDKETTKCIIQIDPAEPIYYLDESVTYAQVDAWFGHVTRDLKMDIVYPQNANRNYPCIVWICGGGWVQMDKGAHMPYLTELARRGFVVASVEYRLSNEALFPAALIDIKAAIRYLRAHAERYSIDAARFGVMGESAGGYLSAMIALTGGRAEFEAGSYLDFASDVQAACPWYMPADFPNMPEESNIHKLFFGGDPAKDEKLRHFTDPVTYITAETPPFLLLHGTHDETVPFSQGEYMYDALHARQLDARLVGIADEGHAGQRFFQRVVWDMIADFFKEKLEQTDDI